MPKKKSKRKDDAIKFEQLIDGKWVYRQNSKKLEKRGIVRIYRFQPQLHLPTAITRK